MARGLSRAPTLPAVEPTSPEPTGRPEPAGRLRVDTTCTIDLAEVEWRFTTSGGPGGQHANRSHTRVEARLDLASSASLTDAQRRRLVERLGPVATVVVDETRSQTRNRTLALERLRAKLAAALVVERPRRPTRPSKAAKRRRVESKKARGEIKRGRARPGRDD